MVVSSAPGALAGLSREEKARLFDRLRQKRDQTADPEARRIPRRPADLDPLPLSFAQERLWFLNRLEPGNINNIPTALVVRGELSVGCLEAAFREVIRRHETLRTTFSEVEGRPAQVIAPPGGWSLLRVDLEGVFAASEDLGEAEVRHLAAGGFWRPYDLERGPLLRGALVQRNATEHLLLLDMHHIVSDGWSMGVLVREASVLYAAALEGRPSPLPELPVQYADFAFWQRTWLSGETLERQLAWWRERLAGHSGVLQLPTDRPRPPVQSFRGGFESLGLGPELTAGVAALAARHGVTLFMALLAAFNVLLQRYASEDDLLVGTPVANRNRAELEGLIGFFVNTLVLRTRLGDDPDFSALLARVLGDAVGAYAHQDLPFERLVQELAPERDLSRSPLFQVMFVLQNTPERRLELESGLTFAPAEITAGTVKFDLTLSFQEYDGDVVGGAEFMADLFDASTVRRLLEHFRVLLAGAVATPEARLSDLPLLSAGEIVQIARWEEGQRLEPARGFQVHRLFQEQARRTPEAVALVDDVQHLTYAALATTAGRLARRLRALGAGPEEPVALFFERSASLVTAMIAVLEAGSYYVPLDPEHPADRLARMLADSGCSLVLTQIGLAGLLPPHGAAVVLVDEPAAAGPALPDIDLDDLGDEALAYLLYTSGSTGRPKGVLVPHRALGNHMLWLQERFPLVPGDRMLQRTPVGFDPSATEIWAPLLAGATLVLARPGGHGDPAYLAAACAEREVTVLQGIPTLMRAFLEEEGLVACRSLRRLYCGGEVLTADVQERFFATPLAAAGAELINLYGPTEAAIDVTSWRCEPERVDGPAPLGGPITNTRLQVLGPRGTLCPVGVPGELYIGGWSVSQGYQGMPAETAARFVPDPWSEPGSRLYRTGDLVRWRVTGDLEYLGRTDHQVKVRGVRIELEEIEAALEACPLVREVAVTVVGEGRSQRLAAYAVPAGEVEVLELRAWLRGVLPEPMMPSVFVLLPALPRTAHGKLDRKALPAPEASRDPAIFTAPRTPLEEALAAVWKEVLGVDRVGAEDEFFKLGGHSLLATQVVSRLRERLGVEVPVRVLFEAPVLADLARAVEQRIPAGSGAGRLAPIARRPPGLEPLPLSFAQERLWFLNRLEPGNINNIPTALMVRGDLSAGGLEAAFREVVRRHETLRTTFAEAEGRPVQVIAPPGGWSLLRVDLEGIFAASEDLGEAAVRQLAAGGFWRPYDLEKGPLLRGTLVRRNAVEHLLLLDMHHIVSDGWSMGVLVREASVLYAAALEGRPSPLPELPVQYADFALWQRTWLSGETLERQLAWWREHLAGHSGVLHLPTDRPRPPVQSFRGGFEPLNLGPELTAGVAALAARHGVTLFMAMLAAFNILLQRYANQDDILVGTPVANRNRAELEELIGFFVNTLVLRTRLGDDPVFSDLLARVRADSVGAYAHQDLPFERLVQELAPERDLSRSPLFQVQLTLQNTPVQRLELESGLTFSPAEIAAGTARFDLVLSFQEYGGDVVGGAEFKADLLDASTVRRLLEHFRVLLAGAVAAPEMRLSELPLLSAEETVQIAGWGEGRRLEVDRGLQVHRLFQKQARRTPEAVALIAPWTAEHLTYAALAAGAERLARRLRAFGIGPEIPVALFLERSVPLVTAMIAVLETGGYYVPLETEHPLDRLAWVLADSGCPLVLTTSDLEERLPARGAQVVLLDDLAGEPGAAGEAPPEAGPGGEALAYLLYTSGSTGRPKGVLVQHGAVVSHIRWYEERFPLFPGDRFLQRTPIGFDPSVTEIWAPLLAGAALVLAEPGRQGDMAYLAAVCAEQEITLVKGVPSLYRMLLEEPGLTACRSLRRMWTGGEVLGPDVLERFFASPIAAGAELINVYGPTETTVEVTAGRCEPERADRPASLGGPIAGTRLQVLGPRGTVCPVGVPGEMYIGGRPVGRGYQGMPAETAARFVPDPRGEPGGRMYRTGDLVRWLPAGDLEFLGRTDQQVKVRGVRIELEEIEIVLQGCPLVREAAVAVVGEGPNQRLVAYVVPAGSNVDARDEVRAWLRDMLPELMMPSAFVFLPALPQTAHGKLDRKALPDPEAARDPAAFTAPRTPVEEVLAEVWKEVLGVERVGAKDEFFDLGGHSLLATQVVSRLRERLGVEVQVRALFETPVLADFARALEQQGALVAGVAGVASGPIPRRPAGLGPLPLSFAQERLWFLDRLDTGTAYNLPLALRISGDLSVAALEGVFRELVRRHEALRTTFAEVGDQAVQVIAPPGGWSLLRIDLSGLFAASPELGEAEVLRLAMTGAWRPFDLRRGPLLRAALADPGEGERVLLLDMHHIVSDGWSMGVLVREVSALYAAAVEGRPSDRPDGRLSPLPELPIQYADFAVWQRGWLTGEVLEAQLDYWRERLAGAPSLDLPTDRPRPVTQSFRGARVRFDIEPEQAQPLAALSRSRDASLFMTLLAACQILLGRQTGQEDVITGSAIANRTRAELEPLIGFFVNSLVLRGDLSGDPTFLDMLDQARRATLDAYSHQDLPFERLVEELNPERKLSHNPLFQVMFALQNMPLGRVDLPGITLAPVEFDFPTTRFDLEIYFWEAGSALAVDLIYATDLFDEPTFQRFAAHLRNLIAEVVADPARPLSALNLLSEPERLQLLEWNDTGAELPAASLVDLFEEQAAARPGAVAVSSDEGDLTYADLDRRSARLARRLAGLGVGPEVPVALLAERSPAMIVGLLAILKAGGAYLPLDPAYPGERLAWMREDAGARILLAQPDLLAGLPEKAREGVAVELTADPEEWDGADPVRSAFDNLAYVMYTSGSTGRPKAVGVTHRNVVRLVRESGFADLGPEQVFLQLAPISFDASTLEIWAPLANGGRLAVFPSYRPSLEEIGDAVSRWGVTTLWLTAGLFHQMVEGPVERLKPLRQLLAGGDVLSPEHVRRALAALPGCTVINGYGPTEGTTFTCCHPMTGPAEVGSTVPIGTPIGNTRVHVVDTHLRPVPVGVYGELYAGGDGLSRGYLGRPELTAERFVPDPFAAEPGKRLYRTGDVVRLRGDGRIEFQGRRDGQVKLRGYRIELGEIESVLARHPEVREAAVVIQESTDGDKRLVACVVPRPAAEAGAGVADASEHVSQWQNLYEETYGQGPASPASEDPTFNIQGWNSSYTGEPIPADEMREWVEATVDRLLALPHRRVLEVGCGTGLLLFRVAPQAERYRGTDFSAVALDYVRNQLSRPGIELPQVELAQGLADDWSGVGPGEMDLVVLNSVVQYFPGIEYLVRVLEGAVRAVAPGGAVFLGDVRSLPLLEALHASVELHQSRGQASVAELRRRVARRGNDEEELVVDPAFFHALARHLPEISHVEVLHKRGRAHNELTRFRYDVVLHVGGGASRPQVLRFAQDDSGGEAGEIETLPDLERLLIDTSPEAVRIPGLRNARLATEAAALELLAPEGPERRTVEELRRAISERAEAGVEPEEVWQLGERLGYEVRVEVDPASPFRFDAVLWRPSPPGPLSQPPSLLPGEGENTWESAETVAAERPSPPGWGAVGSGGGQEGGSLPWAAYANDPLRRQLARRLVPELRHFLEGELPAFMVPGAFVLLDQLPLTVNGKVDRRALAKLEPVSASAPVSSRVAPRTPAEEMVAGVWSEVLGLEGIGIEDDFFELGGHSLLATQAISRLREAAGVEIPLRTLFEAPTVAGLAREIETLARAGHGIETPPIVRVERDGDAPLSFPQEWMWLLDRIDGSAMISLIPVRLHGELHAGALGLALDELVRRHEVFRTTFPVVDGKPVQRIAPAAGLPMPLVDLQALPEAHREAEVQALANAESRRALDLGRGPVVRALLMRLGREDHTLFLAPHHILFDGWSGGVLLREMAALYGAYRQGRPSPLPELPVQYADYAVWQRQYLQGKPLEGLLGYWRDRLAGPLPVLDLSGGRSGPAVESLRSGLVTVELGPELSAALRALAREQGATLFVVLLAGFQALLHRYTRQTDILVGTSVANRNRSEVEDLIGYFVNTLVLRSDLGGDPPFRGLIDRVREVALGAYAHQDLPFTRLVQELQPDRAASRSPLFQVFLQLQNMPMPNITLPGLEMSGVDAEIPMTTYDLSLVLTDGDAGLAGMLWYNRELLAEDAAASLMERFRILLEGAAADPGRALSALPLLTEAERRQLLAAPGETVRRPAAPPSSLPSGGADDPRCLHRRFEDRVKDDPDAVALVYQGDEITYGDLDRDANRLAWHLRGLGVGPEVLVGICLDRTPEMVTSILATLKAGGAYLPLDPAYPAERLRLLLEDAGARVLITRRSQADRLPELPAEIMPLLLDEESEAIARRDGQESPRSGAGLGNAAYVIYTSGSTGRPKGVVVTHGNVARLFESTEGWFRFDERDTWTLFHSYAFDFSVWEIWGALLHGGRLVIVPFWVSRAPESFYELLERERVTVLNQTPSAFSQLAAYMAGADLKAPKSLRWVIFGGEALSLQGLAPWFERHGDRRPRLVNMYGITETTVHVTYRPLAVADTVPGGAGSAIGEPIPDLTVHVLDERLELSPFDVAGEMYVGGAGLARGYLGRPELTAERFIPDPFASEPGARLYRTGDLARRLPDGDLEYQGRADQQVKIRGFRIEPGEVEAALAAHPGVAEAVVVAREDAPGDRRLVGYVVPDAQRAFPVRQLLKLESEGRLAGRATHELPNGMVVVHQHEGITASIYKEIFEGEVYRRHGIELPPGACVFDIGANMGLFTLWVGKTVPGARIFSFEPIPPTAEVLRLNAELHGLDATVYAAGIADGERTETFTYYPFFPSTSGRFPDLAKDREDIKAHILNEQRVLDKEMGAGGFETWKQEREGELDTWLDEHMKSERVACRLTTVSSVIREHGLDRIDLLKVDAERSELDVLAGIAEEDWPRIRQMVLEVHDAGIRDKVLETLAARGFEAVVEQDVYLEGTELYNVYARRAQVAEASSRGILTPRPPLPSPSHPSPGEGENAGENIVQESTAAESLRPSPPGWGAVGSGGGQEGGSLWSSPTRFVEDLRRFAAERLPEHMLPSALVVLDAFPLTAHGKVDRRALPAPEDAARPVGRPIVEPRTPVERELVDLWKELLGVERVSIYDNFFELGGHSLLLTQLASRIRNTFQVEVPLRILFDVPNVVEMTAAIAERQAALVSHEEMSEMLDELKGLSPEEIQALLEAES